MKKWLSISLLACSALLLTACNSGKSTQTKSTTTQSSQVTSSASKNGYTDPKELKDSYDVVIVGAGGAGMTAAIEAKDAGLNPVIFEKMPVAGGNTSKSSSGMNAAGSKFQKAQGINDTTDAFYEETLKGGKGTNDKELLRYFVDHSAEAIDWLDQNGIKLDNLTITGGMSVKRTHRPTDGSAIGGYLVKGLERNVAERKIPIFVNADVKDIHADNGVVDGVKVQIQGEKAKNIKAKAVIVTTGGYGASKEILAKYRPDLKDYVTTNSKGTTGDGIALVEKLGGQIIDMDKVQIHPTVQQEKGILIGEAVRGEGAILVDDEGNRFVNEMDTRDKVSAAINALPKKRAYLIFDQGVRERAKAIEFYAKQGYVKEGKTVADLAKTIKVPKDNLEKAVANWNKAVESKQDSEFNRTTAIEHTLSTPNYYAIQIAPGVHYSMGGVKINTKTEVLNKDNQPVKGLYVAGELVGGLHGDNRIGGNSVADIVIFGRQAGQQAAAFVKAQ